MPNRFAMTLGLLIVAAIGADLVANQGHAALFLLRKFFDLLEYLSFWR